MYDMTRFASSLQKWNITLSSQQKQQFLDYYQLLIEWNQKINLTSITEFEEVLEKHFLDSLSLASVIDLNRPLSVLDLGTGAGFPGIPLKIVFPDLALTLADSLNKRIRFLNTVIDALHLTGITAIHGRAEEMARQKNHREQYDLVVSRAVANLSTLSEYCLPFVKPDGFFISYKGGECEDEISQARHAIRLLGGKIEHATSFHLPDTDYGRTLIQIRKTRNTPKKYPRKAGTPSREPL